VFRHDLFDGVELHSLRRWSKVTWEGSPEHFFAEDTLREDANGQAGAGELEVTTLGGNEYDVVRLQAKGYEIDDENEPVLKNAPSAVYYQGLKTNTGYTTDRPFINRSSHNPRPHFHK
jgi:hypothetical protein